MNKSRLLLLLAVFGMFNIVSAQVTKKQVGFSYYDLQTNNSIQRRIINENGKIIVTYTGSGIKETSANGTFNDRGTGYAYYNGATWLNDSNKTLDTSKFIQKVEGSDPLYRCGWPNPITTRSNELIISHKAGNSDGLMVSRRAKFSNDTFRVSDTLLSGVKSTWVRAANSGDSIIAIFCYGATGTTPNPSLNGTPSGIDYIVSYNGGKTWSKRDSIPGLNLDNYPTGIGGDNYAIDVKDSIISIITGKADISLFKSTNFGKTWTRYQIVQGNNNPTVGGAFKNRSFGDYSILIDNNGLTHCFWGRLYANDSLSYIRSKTGIVYWNEGFVMNNKEPIVISKTVAEKESTAGEQEYPFYTIAIYASDNVNFQNGYGTGYTSHPSSGIDASGNIYLCYQKIRGVSDTNRYISGKILDVAGNFMTDVYIMKSTDVGKTWIGPYNVSNNDSMEDAFPSLARNVDDYAHIVYQQDNLFGYGISSTASTASHFGSIVENKMIYAKVDVKGILDKIDITAPSIILSDSATEKGFVNDTLKFYANCNTKEIQSKVTMPDPVKFLKSIVDYFDNVDGIDPAMLRVDTPSGTGSNFTQVGVYPVRIYAKDVAGNVSEFYGAQRNGTTFIGSWDTLKFFVQIIANDVTPPTITLDSTATIYKYVGSTFTRPISFGTYVDDNPCSTALTLSSKDNVNTSISGKYYITYTVTDNSGNKDSVQRTVIVGQEPTTNFIDEKVVSNKVSATNTSTNIDPAIYDILTYKWTLKNGSTVVSTNFSSLKDLLNTSVITSIKTFDSLCLTTTNNFNTLYNKPANVKCKYLKYVASSITDVNKTKYDVNVYPNPSQGFVNVSFNGIQYNTGATLKVFNIEGKEVFNTIIKNTTQDFPLVLDAIGAGTFIIQTEVNGETNMKKIVITQ